MHVFQVVRLGCTRTGLQTALQHLRLPGSSGSTAATGLGGLLGGAARLWARPLATVPLARAPLTAVRRLPVAVAAGGSASSSGGAAAVRSALRQLSTTAAASEAAAPAGSRAVGLWLLGCCGLVVGAVVIGGLTRLTESGLSMTKWHPLKGMRPPMTEEEWLTEFEHYKQFPEYKYSGGMTVEDFKRIFYWEYIHRMWGRLIGLAYVVPAAVFFARGRIQPKHRWPVVGLVGLVGLQGIIGYFMVKSGLDGAHVPRVSQYRLALHLGSAFALYLGSLWIGLSNLLPAKAELPAAAKSWDPAALMAKLKSLRRVARGTTALAFLTAISGAFVAGLDAGLVYNSFPKMADRWIPEDLLALKPTILNFFENATTVQFDHRVLGITTLSAVTAMFLMARPLPLHRGARLAVTATMHMAYLQVAMGIATLLYFVPTPLAACHQSGSLTLLTLATWLVKELSRVVPK